MTKIMDEFTSPYLNRPLRSEDEVRRTIGWPPRQPGPSRLDWDNLSFVRLDREIERLRMAKFIVEQTQQKLRELAEPAEDMTRTILADLDEVFHDPLSDLEAHMDAATDELESRQEGE